MRYITINFKVDDEKGSEGGRPRLKAKARAKTANDFKP
jgi:hypothetical protein